MGERGRAAQTYAAKFGWRVFPVYEMRADGVCACKNIEEHSTGKHPRINEWQKTATINDEAIASWWGRWPDANVGVACGAESGIVVLDVDSRHGGDDSLAELETKHGKLPDTPMTITGGGGYHYFFKHPGVRVPNSAGRVGPGIDIRGDGGYVLVPRSNHVSGREYEWEVTAKIGTLPLAELPAWLRAAIVDVARGIEIDPDDDKPVEHGERHGTLLKMAGRMRKAGFSAPEIYAALNDFNQRRCKPPQPNDDVRQIAYDIGQKPTAEAIVEASANGRPQIKINDRDYYEMLSETWAALVATNDPPTLFRKDDMLVRIRGSEEGALVKPVNEDIAYDILARQIAWYRAQSTRNGATMKLPSVPPARIARSVTANVARDIPQLNLIAHSPVFAPSGRLLLDEGYYPDAKVWIALDDLKVLPMPETPTAEDIQESLRVLHDELLSDFVFVGGRMGAHYANMLGLVILPFIRPMVQGPTPLFFIESSTPGSGKTLLANIVKLVATGQPLPARVLPSEEEEVRKVITAELIGARPIIVFDNFEGNRRLNSATIAALMTTSVWSDRMLGSSHAVSLPNRAIWILTGNNPDPGKDFLRRTCQIRLDPSRERPWERSGFRHPNLPKWIRSYRPELVRAVLTLIQSWIAKGKPRGSVQLGSFEEWSNITSGILESVGIEAFMANAADFYEAADSENEGIRTLINDWLKLRGHLDTVSGDLLDAAIENEAIGEAFLKTKDEKMRRILLGKFLRGLVGRVFEMDEMVVKVERVRDHHVKSWKYRLTRIEKDS